MDIGIASDAEAPAVAAALRTLGHTPRELGSGANMARHLLDAPPELALNLTAGRGGGRSRAAALPALCEALGVACTGPDALSAALCDDLDLARRLAQDAGVPVPRGMVLGAPRGDYDGDFAEFAPLLTEAGLALPVSVRPAFGGREVAVTTAAEFGPAVVACWRESGQPALVAESIAGDAVTVGVLGDDPPHVFGVMRAGLAAPECPAKLSRAALKEVEESALAIADVLGLRDAALVHFRVHDGTPFFLAADATPALGAASDFAIMAESMNVELAEVVGKIVAGGVSRLR